MFACIDIKTLQHINVICGIRFAMGLSVYLHTAIAAQTPTAGSWGDASTVQGRIEQELRPCETLNVGWMHQGFSRTSCAENTGPSSSRQCRLKRRYYPFAFTTGYLFINDDAFGSFVAQSLVERLTLYARECVGEFHWVGIALSCLGGFCLMCKPGQGKAKVNALCVFLIGSLNCDNAN